LISKQKLRKKHIGLEKNNCRKSQENIFKRELRNTNRENAGGFDSLDSSNN